MRRLVIALAIAPLVALAAAPALACKPAPPRVTEDRPTPRYDDDQDDIRPVLPAPPRRAVNPWSASDSARFDHLLDVIAAIAETVTPHTLGVEDAKNAIRKYLAQTKTTAAALVAEGKALAARLQEQPDGFQAYMTSRMERLQRMSTDMAKLTPDQSRAVSELFAME